MLGWACTERVLQGSFLNCRQVVASWKMNVRSLGIKWSPEDCPALVLPGSQGDMKGQVWDEAAPETPLTEIVCGARGTLREGQASGESVKLGPLT